MPIRHGDHHKVSHGCCYMCQTPWPEGRRELCRSRGGRAVLTLESIFSPATAHDTERNPHRLICSRCYHTHWHTVPDSVAKRGVAAEAGGWETQDKNPPTLLPRDRQAAGQRLARRLGLPFMVCLCYQSTRDGLPPKHAGEAS